MTGAASNVTEMAGSPESCAAEYPGVLFQIIYGPNGQTPRAEIQPGLSTDQVLESLMTLTSSTEDIAEVDLTQVGPHLDWDRLAGTVLGLLQKESLDKLTTTDDVVRLLSGKCQGIVLKSIKNKYGEDIDVAGTKIKFRDVVDISSITNKIQGSTKVESKKLAGTIDLLHNIESIDVLPPRLIIGIAKAHKYIRKKLKINKKHIKNIRTQSVAAHFQKCKKDTREPTSHYKPVEDSDSCDEVIMVSSKNRKCYICRKIFCMPEIPNPATLQYPRLCPLCAQFNLLKRIQKVDLTERIAVVTGGRIKIGYETVLKLLRGGCQVIATTRFPHDAAQKFTQEEDHHQWLHNLKIYPLDLKDINGQFCI